MSDPWQRCPALECSLRRRACAWPDECIARPAPSATAIALAPATEQEISAIFQSAFEAAVLRNVPTAVVLAVVERELTALATRRRSPPG